MLVAFAWIPAKPHQPNEDLVAATSDAVVLLDGAGTPAGSESGCVHGVAWVARRLGTALLTSMTRDDDSNLVECLAASIKEVCSLHADTCDLEHPGSPSATVVALRFSNMLSIILYSLIRCWPWISRLGCALLPMTARRRSAGSSAPRWTHCRMERPNMKRRTGSMSRTYALTGIGPAGSGWRAQSQKRPRRRSRAQCRERRYELRRSSATAQADSSTGSALPHGKTC